MNHLRRIAKTRRPRRAALALALGLQPAVVLFGPASPASACHGVTEGNLLPSGDEGYDHLEVLDPVWEFLTDFLGGRDPRDTLDVSGAPRPGVDDAPEHRIKTADGELGSSECTWAGPTVAPGETVVSDANDLDAGDAFGIRLAMNSDCTASGTYYDFAGGLGPAFVAAWEVPLTAPAGRYVACLTRKGSPVAFTHIPVAVW